MSEFTFEKTTSMFGGSSEDVSYLHEPSSSESTAENSSYPGSDDWKNYAPTAKELDLVDKVSRRNPDCFVVRLTGGRLTTYKNCENAENIEACLYIPPVLSSKRMFYGCSKL